MRFFTILFIILFPLIVQAQENNRVRRFDGGLIIGMNAGQMNGDQAAGYRKLGFVGGVKANIILQEKLNVGLEMLFSQRGSTESRPNLGVFPFKVTLNYIEVPVYINYKDWLSSDETYYRMQFYTGFSYARLFSYTTDTDTYEILGEYFKKNDLSWLGGATYYLNENIGISARYTRALTPLFRPNDNTPNANALTTHQISLLASYTF